MAGSLFNIATNTKLIHKLRIQKATSEEYPLRNFSHTNKLKYNNDAFCLSAPYVYIYIYIYIYFMYIYIYFMYIYIFYVYIYILCIDIYILCIYIYIYYIYIYIYIYILYMQFNIMNIRQTQEMYVVCKLK